MSEKKKRLVVELWAEETAISRRLVVVEVPSDCSAADIEKFEGEMLDQFATQNGSDSAWEFEEYEGNFEIRSDIDVGRSTDESPDIELTFDELGNLVAAQCQ